MRDTKPTWRSRDPGRGSEHWRHRGGTCNPTEAREPQGAKQPLPQASLCGQKHSVKGEAPAPSLNDGVGDLPKSPDKGNLKAFLLPTGSTQRTHLLMDPHQHRQPQRSLSHPQPLPQGALLVLRQHPAPAWVPGRPARYGLWPVRPVTSVLQPSWEPEDGACKALRTTAATVPTAGSTRQNTKCKARENRSPPFLHPPWPCGPSSD